MGHVQVFHLASVRAHLGFLGPVFRGAIFLRTGKWRENHGESMGFHKKTPLFMPKVCCLLETYK